MKNFVIITNDRKDPQYKLTDEIINYIESQGGHASRAIKSMDASCLSVIPNEDIDCVLVLGGDGTMLRAARDITDREIPMLGINLGTLGFLADIEKDRYKEAIDQLLKDDCHIQKRMTLGGKIIRATGEEIVVPGALNDILVTKQGTVHIINVDIYVNGQFLYSVPADGIIASTPTGSTGYSMSAGGPIIHPRASLIAITPICAHTMNSRTVVMGPDDVVEFVIGEGRDGDDLTAEVTSDGGAGISVKTGDRIVITKGNYVVNLVKIHETSFLQTLNRKMSN